MDHHALNEPAWTCTHDGLPWPCSTRRAQLLTEYRDNPAELRTLLIAGFLHKAYADLPDRSVDEVYEQIVAWVEPMAPRASAELVTLRPARG